MSFVEQSDGEDILQPELPICDPHHHLWDHPGRRYLLDDFLLDAGSGHKIVSTVFVEALAFYRADGPESLRYVGETEFAAGAAAMTESGRYGEVRVATGIVGRVDLAAGNVDEALDAHRSAGGGRFCGVRHSASLDPSPLVPDSYTGAAADLYDSSSFRAGFARLAEQGLTCDTWQYFHQLPALARLAADHPQVQIMVDHLGGPLGIGPYAERRVEAFEQWQRNLQELAQRPNVWMKIGGLGMPLPGLNMEGRTPPASSEELAEAWRPYVETALNAFGVERCMFQSNFPVDRPSCSYATLWNAFKRIASGASADELAALFHDNAIRFYGLHRRQDVRESSEAGSIEPK